MSVLQDIIREREEWAKKNQCIHISCMPITKGILEILLLVVLGIAVYHNFHDLTAILIRFVSLIISSSDEMLKIIAKIL